MDKEVDDVLEEMVTHIWPLDLLLAFEDLPQHVNGRIGLDGDPGVHALLVDVPDEFARAGLARGGVVGGLGRGGGGHGRFVVEAVEVATGGLEFLDPFLRLYISKTEKNQHLVLREG